MNDKDKLVIIYTDRQAFPAVNECVFSVYRLHELVDIVEEIPNSGKWSGKTMRVENDTITLYPDWKNLTPPVLFPIELPYHKSILLGLIYFSFGNFKLAREYLLVDDQLLLSINTAESLMKHRPFFTFPDDLTSTEKHNNAVLIHYGNGGQDLERALDLYEDAARNQADIQYRWYSQYHRWMLMVDLGKHTEVLVELESAVCNGMEELPKEAEILCKGLYIQTYFFIAIQQGTRQCNPLLAELIDECSHYYENSDPNEEYALFLIELATWKRYTEAYSESLDCLEKALKIFQKTDLSEMIAHTHIERMKLFCVWAQQGKSQFYREALKSANEALRVFTKDTAPRMFADIHHHLGMIYAEIPDEVHKKSLWASLSVSSFEEAMRFYTAQDFPYMYSVLCNHQGNAFTRYPAALYSDNFEKAMEWYQRALEIRNADIYPKERAATLLNYVEAAWHKNITEEGQADDHYADMLERLKEIKKLTDDKRLLSEAEAHIEQLKKLETDRFVHLEGGKLNA